MGELVEPEKFLIQLDFEELVPAGPESKRIGSKAYILSHGIFNDGFTLKEIEGDIDGAEMKKEEVRNKLGVYSDTELQKLKRNFLEKDLLVQKQTRGPYYLTDLGFNLLETYVNLIRLDKVVKKFQYIQTKNQLYILENLGKLPITPDDLPTFYQEEVAEMTETEKMWEKVDTVAVQEETDDRDKPKKLMKKFFRAIFEENMEPLENLERTIKKGVDVVRDSAEELENNGCSEEAEEIYEMIEKTTQAVDLTSLNSLEKEEESNALDDYSSDQDWSLEK